MNLDEARKLLPELQGLDDPTALNVIQQVYYPDLSRDDLAKRLGYTPPKAKSSAGVARTVADMGIKLGQGVIDLGQSAVGAASLATGGLAGQGLRALGYDPQAANQMLAEYLSPQQRESEQAVQDAEGFVDTMIAAAKNPRAVAGSVVESVPGMLGIGAVTNAVARRIALKAAAPFGGLATEAGQKAAQEAVDAATNKLLLASGIGEGGQSAGQIADQAQAAGRDYSQYALPALAAGATTAAITRGAGKLMGSAETALFSGSKAAGPQGSLPVRLAKAAFSEGALQEMPQSAQEQAMTNIAMGEPDVMKGVGNQAAMGLVTGGVMGLGEGAGAPHQTAQKAAADAVRKQDTVPEVGPLSAAANVATEAKAQAIENAPPAPPVEEPAPVIDPIAERIQRMQGQDREDAMHAYGIVQRDDVPKGVRQYNSKLLDKLLEKYEHPAERPMDMTASDTAIPTPEWGTERGAAPDRGALDFQRDIPTGDLALAQERPLLALPAPVVTVDNAGQAATGAQLAEREQAAQAEARRKRELGLTPDVEQAAQTRAAPKPAAAVTPPATAAEKPATAAAALPADILAKSGKPFASRLPAMNAAKKAGPGHEVVQVPGGFAVRKTGDWQAFPATTGTLGLPRAELPQVHAQAHGALVNFLTARGIEHQTEEVDPASLKPSQAEYSEAKAAEQAGSDSERAILVSSDGHVVDGHHLWLAAGAEGKPVKVIRFNAPADKLLPIVKEFPSAKSAQATAEAAAPAAVPAGNGQAAEVQPRADVADRANGAAEQPHATLTEAAKAAEKGQDHAPDQQHEQGRVQQERGSRDEGRQAAEAGGSDRVQRAAPGSEAERSRSGEAGDQGKVANEKTPPASDTAGAADKPLTLGITPASAEPITVRGGVIYVGKDPALNYDTGEPVTVAEDATSEQIKQAMKDAGAVSKRQHFYGGKAVEAESGKAAAPGTSAAAASEGESHGQGQKEEVLKAAGEQSPAGEAAPTKEDAAPAKSERTAAEIAREIAKDRPDEDFAAVREAARKAIVAELGQKAADEMGRGNFLAGDELTQAVHDGQYEAVREYAAKMPVPVHESDIPRETANRAYMGTSHNPERRGASAQRDYVRQMVQAWKAAERAAGNDPQAVARITEAMQSLVSGYRQRYLASLASHANVMSAMIAGPANFPVERNRKRIAAADKRAQDASEFLQKGIARMLKAAKAPVDNSPQSELDRIKANLSEREAAQEKMRAANAALRKGDDAALKALGFSDERIAALKKGDFAGRKGFADYQLANNNAEIRRLRERLASAQQRVTEAEAGPVERTYKGVQIEENAQDDRLRLVFEGKPSAEVRDDLKKNGFRWSPTAGAWQRQLTDNARYAAKQVLDKHFPASEAQMSRSTPTGSLPTTTVQDAVSKLTGSWLRKPDIHILETMDEAPEPVRKVWLAQNSQGAIGDIEGFHWRGGVYLVAEAMHDNADVARVLYHEALGHFGLRGVFGETLGPILKQLATARPELLRRKAAQYGFDLKDEKQRLSAAEEVLAELAQTHPELGFVKRAIAAIRAFLREHVPGFAKMKLTDSDIIAQFILPARGWVENGKSAVPVLKRAAFSRSDNGGMDLTDLREAYRRFNETGESTGRDLLNDVDFLLQDGRAPTWLQESVDNFRQEIIDDETIYAGRGDVDAAEERFVAAVERALSGPAPFARSDVTNTEAFRKWFGDSKVVDAEGKPLVVYHGTPKAGFSEFVSSKWPGVAGWFHSDQEFANVSADPRNSFMSPEDGSAAVYPVYLSLQNPLDLRSLGERKISIERLVADTGIPLDVKAFRSTYSRYQQENQPWSWLSTPEVLEAVRNAGHDGVMYEEDGPAFIAFRPEQIKSATGNRGTFDASNPDIRFSRSTMAGPTTRQYTPEQERAMRNVGFQVQQPTLKERAHALWKDAGKKLAQGLVDQFAPIKDLDAQAYGLLRLAKGASGAFETFLHGGKLKLNGEVYDFDETQRGGVIEKLLIPLGGEHHDFMRWIAANRAERLMAEDREHLFTPEDIAALKTLADGTLSFDFKLQHGANAGQTTRNRAEAYRDSLATFNEFNKNALDMAEQSGLIDGEARKSWEHLFYVPFYRVADEESGVRGMNIKSGVVRQQAFKQLKGGKDALSADLLDNTLMNWAHLLDAAAKNRAAKATLEAAQRMGLAIEAPQEDARQIGKATGNRDGVVWFMDGGKQRFFVVDDKPTLTAISGLEFAGMRGPMMQALGTFKHALTVGVTASPFFKVRNLIRDSLQAIATAPLSYNVAGNLVQGWKLTNPKSDVYFRLMAGGGTIHFGTMLEGSEGKRVQALIESGVPDSTILNSDSKIRAWYRQYIEPGITAYNELGNRGEAINRASLYDQLVKQGMSHAEASLQARDLMDFSMQGSFTTIRFLAQTVPFLNARIVGLAKLGRAAKQDPVRFAAVLGSVALVSLALLAAYHDDDDWKKRELWDRQTYWWFKFGGVAFRIPKPFEIGAIATLAEHGAELMMDDEMTGKRFREAVLQLTGNNLSMNPIPQLVKPMLDVYANQDSYTGRPIESMGMERLQPEYRFNDRTTMAARAASTGLNTMTRPLGIDSPSPVQIDHLLRGYFGWLGTFVVSAGDALARPATGQPTQATPDYWKTATGGMISSLEDAPSKYVSEMYQQAKEIEQAYGTWHEMVKQGRAEEAAAFREDNKELLGKYRQAERIKRSESKLNEQVKLIERADIPAEEKRSRLRQIQERKDRLARGLAPS